MTLVDPDRVDLTNLHRQLWHTDADLDRPKVDSAAEKLRAQFPHTRVDTLRTLIDAKNGPELFKAHDVVLDCTDGPATKFLLSDLAVQTGATLIHGGCLKLEGQTLRIQPDGPCLRCFFEGPARSAPSCALVGVLGSVVGIVGARMAQLAFAPNPERGCAALWRFDGRRLQTRVTRVRKARDCDACSQTPAALSMRHGDRSNSHSAS